MPLSSTILDLESVSLYNIWITGPRHWRLHLSSSGMSANDIHFRPYPIKIHPFHFLNNSMKAQLILIFYLVNYITRNLTPEIYKLAYLTYKPLLWECKIIKWRFNNTQQSVLSIKQLIFQTCLNDSHHLWSHNNEQCHSLAHVTASNQTVWIRNMESVSISLSMTNCWNAVHLWMLP